MTANSILVRAILFLLAVAAALFVCTHPGGDPRTLLLLGAVVTTFLILNPKLLLGLIFCFSIVTFKIPGLYGRLKLDDALMGVLFLYGFSRLAMTKERRPIELADFGLILFGLSLFLVIMVRGFGMAILGSGDYGGKVYIFLFFALAAYRFAPKIELTASQMRRLIGAIVVSALLMMVIQAIIYLAPSLYFSFEQFVETHANYLLSMQEGEASERVRWQAAGTVATPLLLVSVAFFARRRNRIPLYLSLAFVIGLSLLSGFRNVLVSVVITSVVMVLATSRQRVRDVVVLIIGAIVAYGMLIVTGPYLPYSVQRALSFLPGMQWSPDTVLTAAGTVEWRLAIWKMAWANIPKYLFIGRGLLLENVYEHAWMPVSYYRSGEFYYATHSYHSGPLSLILDTGILGLVGFFLFQIGIVLSGIKLLRSSRGWRAGFLESYLYACVILAATKIFSFYFLFGDIRGGLPDLVLLGILIQITGRIVRERALAETVSAATDQTLEPRVPLTLTQLPGPRRI